MTWIKRIIDSFGIGFGIYLATLFYGTFWQARMIQRRFFALGLFGLGILNLILVQIFQNSFWMPIAFILIMTLLALYYECNIIYQALFASIFSALIMVSEMIVGIVETQVLGLSIEYVQEDLFLYAVGLLGSNLLAFVLIRIISLFALPKNQPFYNKWLSLSLVFLPLQSLILCFVVQDLAARVNNVYAIFLGGVVLSLSFFLIFITMFTMDSQMKALMYKQGYETTQQHLQAQVEHYNELYESQKEIRSLRHEMNNSQVALLGLLEKGEVAEALEKIKKDQSILQLAGSMVDTGFPSIDAILNAILKKSNEQGVSIHYKVLIDNKLHIDQFDLALLLANALDNALEAVVRNPRIDTDIHLHITDKLGFLSILVENHAAEEVDKDLRSSKKDKLNHGFGIRNMKAIALKYEGDFTTEYDLESQIFSLRVLLKNKKSNFCA